MRSVEIHSVRYIRLFLADILTCAFNNLIIINIVGYTYVFTPATSKISNAEVPLRLTSPWHHVLF